MDLSQEGYYEDWGGDSENRNGFVVFSTKEMQEIVKRAMSGKTYVRLVNEYNMDVSSFAQKASMKYRWFLDVKDRVTGTTAPGANNKRLAVCTKLKIFATCK